MHSTDYFDTFIVVAPDTKAKAGVKPGARAATARVIYDMIRNDPYRYTSDDVIYAAHASSKGRDALTRDQFFARGQACLRASALTKTLGWGVHFDKNGRVALYGMETPEYAKFARTVPVKAAMRNAKSKT